MTKSIQHTFFYPHPPEAVWAYLTKAELLELWLMKNDFQPIVGYDFQFWTKPLPDYDFDGIVYCKVLEIIPFKKLSYSWKGGAGKGKPVFGSVVAWTLVARENGTELNLEHSGFNKMENLTMYSIMNEGWRKNIQRIAELINAVTPATANT